MKNHDLLGFWDLVSLRVKEDDGEWIDEKVLSGSAAFSDSRVLYASRTTELMFGFAGTYRMEDLRMLVRFDTNTFPHLEGQVITREVEKLTPSELILSGIEVETCRKIELIFVRGKTNS